jgi:TPR repeat protein
LYIGIYYNIEENYEEAKKYYMMAVELGHSNAMYNLGFYYNKIEKNYEEAKKYYIMAIKTKNYDFLNLFPFQMPKD